MINRWISTALVAVALLSSVAKCTLVQADEIYDWSNTAANNNNAPPDGFPENMNYSEVNDAARELMAVVKRHVEAIDGTNTTAGTEPAYTLSSGQSLGAAAGHIHVWTAHATSTGSATLNVDAAGAKNLVDATGVQLGAGGVVSGGVYMSIETGSAHRVIGSLAAPAVSAPASSTDEAVARFNGTGGTVLQNSGVTIDDSNNVAGATTLTLPNTGLHLLDTNASHDLIIAPGTNITADRTLTVTTGDANRTLTIGADSSISGTAYVSGGTDVAIADGGTGASSASAAFTALKQAATESDTGVVELATTAEAVTGTDTARAVTPAGLQASIDANTSSIVCETVQATTSGTAFDFTSLPAGLNRITVTFAGVDLSGTDNYLVQIGDSGGLETSGYSSESFNRANSTNSTSGFLIFRNNEDSGAGSGAMTLMKLTGDTWTSTHALSSSTSGLGAAGGGSKTLSAELDRVRLTRSGTNTFGAGQVNVCHE